MSDDERCAPSLAFHPERRVNTGCASLHPFVVSTGRLGAIDHVEYRQVRVSGDSVVGRDAGRNLCCFALHARRAPVPRAIDAPSFHTLCLVPSVVLLLVNHLELWQWWVNICARGYTVYNPIFVVSQQQHTVHTTGFLARLAITAHLRHARQSNW